MRLGPDQVQQNVGPDLGSNSLQRLSKDDTFTQRVKVGVVFGKVNSHEISMAIYSEKEKLGATFWLTLSPIVSSADKFCKQFGPRSGPTECLA